MFGRVSACKHANGVDYWVMVHEFFTNSFYKVLVRADTMIVDTQSIGMINSNISLNNYYGQAIFNSMGTKYAVEINDTTVELYDFNRCSGLLSNPAIISHLDTTQAGGGLALTGSAFSASGQYLYVNNNYIIRQYDAYAANVLATEQVVAVWDTFSAPCCGVPTTFFMMQLAPDNRIYVSQSIGNDILHYIEFPDSAGMACHVVQNSFFTPTLNTFSFPNIVNYDLMNDTTSLCDTILSVGKPEFAVGNQIKVFPNPTTDYFWVNYSLSVSDKAVLEIYDELGNRVQQNVLYGHSKTLLVHLANLREGVYYYKVVSKGTILGNGKLLVVR
ncbi:MAG: T9SS type A sorting domain-containing protein [Bacteroidota bacterium]